jgi:hypothetical protein
LWFVLIINFLIKCWTGIEGIGSAGSAYKFILIPSLRHVYWVSFGFYGGDHFLLPYRLSGKFLDEDNLVRHRPPWVFVIISMVEAVTGAIGSETAIAMQMSIPVGVHVMAAHAVSVIAYCSVSVRYAARQTCYDANG